MLFKVGDERYPFIAILEGEAAILDAAGDEIVRHGTSGFLGELNLMSGQTVYLTAVVTQPMRYIAVEREVLRPLLFEDGPLGDVLLSAFIARREALQRRQGIGVEIIGPRSSAETRALVDYLRRARLPHTWRDTEHDDDPEAAALVAALAPDELPLVRLPGGTELRRPSSGEMWRALGHRRRARPARGGRPRRRRRRPRRPRRRGLRRVRGPRHAGDREHRARRPGRHLAPDRELPRLPGRHQRHRADRRAPSPRRASSARGPPRPTGRVALEPGADRHVVRLDGGEEVAARAVVLATGAEYRRLPVAGLEDYEGISVFYAAGPPEAQRCGATRVAVVGGGNSAAQAAIWLSRGGALVTLLHRRADLRETMSDYLIGDLERHGVAVRDRSEIAELHGADGQLEAVTLRDGEQLPVSFLFLFLGAAPCTDWLGDRGRPRREGLRPDRRRRRRREPLETSRARRLRRRRRALRLAQALRHRGRRGRHGRAARARAAEQRARLSGRGQIR